MSMREEFEARFPIPHGMYWHEELARYVQANFRKTSGRKADEYKSMWFAWKESRSALVVELPPKWNDPANSNMQAWDMGIDDARKAIEAAGVRVKP